MEYQCVVVYTIVQISCQDREYLNHLNYTSNDKYTFPFLPKLRVLWKRYFKMFYCLF